MLIRIIKNYKDRNYTNYSPNGSMEWEGIRFTEQEINVCDGVVVINTPRKPATVKCPPENIVAIMQEAYHEGDSDYVEHGLEQYRYVITNHIPEQKFDNTQIFLSHGALPWHVLKTYDELKAYDKPLIKEKNISCIASNLTRWSGHRKRVEFVEYLKEHNNLEIDFFGKGTKFVEDKWDAIAPYKYSVVIENNDIDDYWTEKISDVYLGYALPFYFGCTNIDRYFPPESYIWIDINNPEEAVATMRRAIKNNEWEKRLDSIMEARRRVLDEYNLLPTIAKFAKEHFDFNAKKEKVTLLPYGYQKESILNKFEKILKKIGLRK